MNQHGKMHSDDTAYVLLQIMSRYHTQYLSVTWQMHGVSKNARICSYLICEYLENFTFRFSGPLIIILGILGKLLSFLNCGDPR